MPIPHGIWSSGDKPQPVNNKSLHSNSLLDNFVINPAMKYLRFSLHDICGACPQMRPLRRFGHSETIGLLAPTWDAPLTDIANKCDKDPLKTVMVAKSRRASIRSMVAAIFPYRFWNTIRDLWPRIFENDAVRNLVNLTFQSIFCKKKDRAYHIDMWRI